MPTVREINVHNRADYGFVRSMTGQKPVKKEAPAPAASPAPPRVRKISATAPAQKQKLKVAAYCRVSTLDEAQEGSIYSQRRHYEEMIRANDEWELADIYFEHGLSATKAESRPELQRMLADCRSGKINLILTKSISRFSRNTTDCIEMVRDLTALGVTIRFEKEKINTGTMESEFMLSLLSCMAENESHSISANGKWAVRKRYEDGTYKQAIAPYGYQREGTDLLIIPDEAAVVREIFDMILSGYGIAAVAEELNRRGIPGPTGMPWNHTTVRDITRNPAYVGDQLYQKRYVDETFRLKRNKGELDQLIDEDHHEPIISRETFKAAEEVITHRKSEKGIEDGRKQKRYAFSGKLVCAHCGATMKRNSMKYYAIYTCPNRCGCEPEDNVKNAFVTCLNKLAFSQKQRPEKRVLDVYISEIGDAERAETSARLAEIDAALEENQIQADVLTAIALVNHFTPEEHAKKMSLLKENEELRREKVMLSSGATRTAEAEKLKAFVNHWTGGKFPDETFTELVENATVTAGGNVVFRFKCGLELQEELT